VHCQEAEARSKGPRMLSDELRDFSLPLSQFTALGSRTPETARVVRINCRCRRPSPTAGPHHVETAGYARTRDHYGAVTEGPWHLVTSAPMSSTTQAVAPPEKARLQRTTAATTTTI
jgi:hypothetical protein